LERNKRAGTPVQSSNVAMDVTIPTPTQRKAAPIAGMAWLISFVAVVAVSFNIIFPLNELPTAADVARRVLGDERLFRIGIAGYLVNCVAFVVQVAAFYVILEPVDRMLALLAALGRLVHAFTWVLAIVNFFMALGLLKAGEPDLARLYLSGWNVYYVGLLFWSLGAAVGGYLWYRSNYIPRALAAFGVISSAWCAACTFVYYIFPGFADVVNLWWFDSPMVLFELALSGWLVVKGLRPSTTVAAVPARL
jgi:hypothetical protein